MAGLRARRRAVPLLLAVLMPPFIGCAHAAAPPSTHGPAGPVATQSLLRVDYHGPDGQGRLRLILRRHSAESFRLDADDPLGRALWTLWVEAEELTLVDHRARAWCRGAGDVSIPERGLGDVPVRAAARVLLGELPVAPPDPPGPDGSLDFVDPEGRRWTATLAGGEPVRWTLWRGGGPMVWWQRSGRGGILSHRAGGQFRWRVAVSEPLPPAAGGGADRVVPADYEAGSCGGVAGAGAPPG